MSKIRVITLNRKILYGGIAVTILSVVIILLFYLAIFRPVPRAPVCLTPWDAVVLSAPNGSHCKLADDGTLPLAIDTSNKRWMIIGLSCLDYKYTSATIITNITIDNPVLTGGGRTLLSDTNFNHHKCISRDGTTVNTSRTNKLYIYIKYIDLATNHTHLATAEYLD